MGYAALLRADPAEAPVALQKDPVLLIGSDDLRGTSYSRIISVSLSANDLLRGAAKTSLTSRNR